MFDTDEYLYLSMTKPRSPLKLVFAVNFSVFEITIGNANILKAEGLYEE